MTLIPTTGYIKHTEMQAYYLQQTTDDDSVLGFGIMTRPQPDSSRDDYEYGYEQSFSAKYNDSGGTSLTRKNTLSLNDSAVALSQTGDSANTSWSSESDMDSKTNGTRRAIQIDTGIDLRVDNGALLSHHTGTATAYTVALDAIHLRRRQDKTRSEYIETTGIHHDTADPLEWTPFDENECCSSFIMKQVATNNTLTVNFQSAESRTYPLFRVTP